jgi:hypothetical protein
MCQQQCCSAPRNLAPDRIMIKLLPNLDYPRPWWQWAAAAVIAELLWFCGMYPLVPKTVGALAFEAVLPLPLLVYIYLAVVCLLWISKWSWPRWTKQLLGTAIALSVVAAAIWVVDWAVLNTSAEFRYLTIRGV